MTQISQTRPLTNVEGHAPDAAMLGNPDATTARKPDTTADVGVRRRGRPDRRWTEQDLDLDVKEWGLSKEAPPAYADPNSAGLARLFAAAPAAARAPAASLMAGLVTCNPRTTRPYGPP